MNVLLLHLSDLHIDSKNDAVLPRAAAIAKSLQVISPSFEACIVTFSGDVAYSGDAAQYNLAYEFFQALTSKIKEMYGCEVVAEIYVPGNHDCILPAEAVQTRKLLVDAIIKDAELAPPDQYMLDQCLAVQSEFFKFAEARGVEIKTNERMRYSIQVNCGGSVLRFHCYNTAALSQRRDVPGRLLAPVWLQELNELPQDDNADLVVSMFHHPLGWLEPNNARAFRRKIDDSSDIVLTGHEHVSDGYRKVALDGNETLYVEGAVLQDSYAADNSAYCALLIDTTDAKYKTWKFTWSADYYRTVNENDWLPLSRQSTNASRVLEPTEEFTRFLNNPGAGFTHSQKSLCLDDIFIYPDIDERDPIKKISSPITSRILVTKFSRAFSIVNVSLLQVEI